MLFPSFDFLLFLIPVLLVHWALCHRPKAWVLFLLATSYFFYVGGPKLDPPQPPWYYVGLLVFSTLLDYVCSQQIHAQRSRLEHPDVGVVYRARRIRNAWLGTSLVGNLGLLGYYKYTNFLLQAFSDIARSFGLEFVVPHLHILLPIGISFYTFQTLSYTIDVWRGELTPEPSLSKFALFVVFFPQLVAGPIVRAREFLPQLHTRLNLSPAAMQDGLFRIFKGLVKKVVLGDWIAAQFTDRVFDAPETYTSLEILLALYAFTVQLYADFSGYSDIAIGVARLMGFRLPENFDRPYQSRNVGEFWRRWHMTLSTWLRDYVFFPLGGSRGSHVRTYFNLWTTMILVGMWHGASWNFVIYANLHAFAMVFNRWNRLRYRAVLTFGRACAWMVGLTLGAVTLAWLVHEILLLPLDTALVLACTCAATFLLVAWLPDTGTSVHAAAHVVLTFHFTVLTRVFFRADDLDTSRKMVAGLMGFDGHGIRPGLVSPWVWGVLTVGLAVHFLPKHWIDDVAARWFGRLPGVAIGVAFAALGFLLAQLLSSGPRAFIYFQF